MKRYKNIAFWIGILGTIITASGIDPSTCTSWGVLFQNILDVLSNPFTLISTIMTVVGIYANPTTPGVMDKESDGDEI